LTFLLFPLSFLQVTSHHLLITIIITIPKPFVTLAAAAATAICTLQYSIDALLNFYRHQPQPCCCCCTIPAAVNLPKQLAQTFAQRGQLHVELQPDLFAVKAFANVQCCCELLLLQEEVE
jgi:hypothetical protein